MPLLLNTADINFLMSMKDCVEEIEKAYEDLAHERAVNQPRSEVFVQNEGTSNQAYVFKSMVGAYPRRNVVALRINSDVIRWDKVKTKLPVEGNKRLGFVMLFDVTNAALLALFPDGAISRFRVGATNALGIKYLARKDSQVLGLVGTGWQAGGQLMGAKAVRDIQLVKVYSLAPEEQQEAFISYWGEKLQLNMKRVTNIADLMTGSDIVVTSTNSLEPTIQQDYVSKGMHITCVRHTELPASLIESSDLIFINSKKLRPDRYSVSSKQGPSKQMEKDIKGRKDVDLTKYPELWQLIGGLEEGRTSASQITCFINNIGFGIQFAAAGSIVYKLAKDKGVGTPIPLDWFAQDVRSLS